MYCLYCQKEFKPNPYRKQQKFCSENHQKLAWKKRNRDKDNTWQRKRWRELHPETHITKNCLQCKKEFLPLKFHPYKKYCGWKCRNKFNRTPEQVKKWRKNYYLKNKEKILIKDKYNKARARFGMTSKTLNMKIVLQRDNKICKLCGNSYQVIHHIRYSGKVEDLVALCRACHASIHHKVKKSPFWIGNYKFEENKS